MIPARPGRLAKMIWILALAVALMAIITGCGDKSATQAGDTAKGGFEAARSALSTIAPDAKLLLVQTGQSVTPTSSPVWAYLFGSPETDGTYAVYVRDGTVMSASELNPVSGLSESEWAAVPGIDAVKIDSDEAYDKALAVSGAKGTPAAYNMGLLTYVPSSAATSTTEPLTWYVAFEPGESGATTATIKVNAKTGATSTD